MIELQDIAVACAVVVFSAIGFMLGRWNGRKDWCWYRKPPCEAFLTKGDNLWAADGTHIAAWDGKKWTPLGSLLADEGR